MARILCPSLIGRDAERAQLAAMLDAARRGRGGVVFVTGPPGIGKSRLIGDLVSTAAGLGVTVLSGRSVPARIPVPYRPIAEALIATPPAASILDSHDLVGFRAALAWVVPAWREDASSARVELPVVVAEALLRVLHAMARSTGCVLVVEDLHWADPETLHAVEYLADHAATSSVLCLCTLRDDAGTDAMEVATRLDARRAVEVIRLGPLSADQVGEMAKLSLGTSAMAPEIAELLRDGAEGMPFLVEELLAAAATSGELVRTDDGWHVAAPLRRFVPESFAATVRTRVDAMEPAGRRLLGAAALLGRSFDWPVAARAADCSPHAADAFLEQAVGLQLLARIDGVFSFRHALTRDAIIGELPAGARSVLAARCLEALEATAGPAEEWHHLAADLAEQAGDSDRAAVLLLRAGRTSLARGALDTTMAALERAARIVVDGAVRAGIFEALAEACSAAGDVKGTQSAVHSLLDALAVIDAPPARRAQARLLLARCAVTATHFDLAREEIDRVRHLVGADDPALAARVSAVGAQLAMGEALPDEAEALADQAAAAAAQTQQPEVVCEALEVAARCARTRDLDEAETIGTRALHVAEDARLPLWRMRALYQLGVVDLFRSGGVETLRRARDDAQRLGAVATATSLAVEISAGLEAQYRIDEARALLAECIETARTLELRSLEAMAHAFVAIVEAGRGSRRAMGEAIGRALAIAGEESELVGALWGDARAVASLVDEDRVRARHELEYAVTAYGEAPAVVPRLAAGLLPLVVAVDGGEPDFRAAEGVTLLNGQAAGYLAYARAVLLGRTGHALEAGDAARRGDRHMAQMPWYRHLVRRLAAEAAIVDGWGEPTSWLAEAAGFFDEAGNNRLASACRGLLRRTGARVARPTRATRTLAPDLRQAGVTRREAEVLALIGEGHANREVAARLFLSERTVEQHVAALKQKLGCHTRAQLAVSAAARSGAAR